MPFLTTCLVAGAAFYLVTEGGWFGRGLVAGLIVGFFIGFECCPVE